MQKKLRWIKQLSVASCLWVRFIKIPVSSLFCIFLLILHLGNDEESLIHNYKTSDFDVICHSIVWNSENVLSGVIWAFLDLKVDRSWVTEYHSGIFFLYIPCHSRHRVYLQCHCQLKLKTGGRCNDAERRANIISFSSKTHIDNQFLLWVLPKKHKTTYKQVRKQAKFCHISLCPKCFKMIFPSVCFFFF